MPYIGFNVTNLGRAIALFDMQLKRHGLTANTDCALGTIRRVHSLKKCNKSWDKGQRTYDHYAKYRG